MTAVLTEPDTAKAAVVSEPDMIRMSLPILKAEDTAEINPVDGTPDLVIAGKCTDGTLDSDLQIVDPDASLRWIQTWHATKSNIRMGHDPRMPVGRGIEVDGHNIKALICDPRAKHLIRKKVLNDFSIGIMHPDVRKGDPRFRHLDPMGKAVNGVITDRADGMTGLGEISVVDRGANFGSAFQLVKAAAYVGAWDVEPDEAAVQKAAGGGLVSVELPSDMKLRMTPGMLAKMATLKRDLVLAEAAMKAEASPSSEPEMLVKAATADGYPDDATLAAAAKSAEAGIYKRDIDTDTRRRLAGQNQALPNLSYPVETHEDADNAVTLLLSGHGNVKAARRMVTRIAREKGWTDILDRLKGGKKKTAAADAGKKAGDCASCKGRGWVKPDKNVKCEACGGSGRGAAKSAAAVPDVTKCMKCDDTGVCMGQPCTDCDKGKREAEKLLDAATTTTVVPDVAKKKGKMRAICPNCGAKQNPEHKHCPECGNALPERALQVKKNHDFVCLGCGKDLDKGEPHCPECGKKNPGYNPMADHKIPANADKAAKERVSKKAKKGKMGKPFGGKQNPPFGAKDDDGEGKDDAAKSALVKGKGKGKRYGRNPAAGVKGHDTAGLPPHREPDGAPVEQFENDAHLQDGDQEMKTVLRHKASGLDPELAVLHDLTCAAFSPAAVSKALPYASFSAIQLDDWQQKALNAAAGGSPAEFAHAQALGHAAQVLKTADPQVLQDVRLAGHAAFLDANSDLLKTFRDATPGPGSAPTPGHITPQTFRRPYIGTGHAAESPMAHPMRDFPVINDHPVAADFQRDYISGGHASESPMNGPRNSPVPENRDAGSPRPVEYGSMQRADYDQALRTMHDHVSRIAPGICPMSPAVGEGTQKPAPQVPEAAGGPMPHGAKASKADRKARAAQKAARAAQAKARKAKAAAREQRRFDKAVAAAVAKVQPPEAVLPPMDPATGLPEAQPDLAAALKAAVRPLVKTQKAQARTIRKQRRTIKAIAGQPDTTGAPFRGAGTFGIGKQASTAPAGPRTMADAQDVAQTAKYQLLHQEWRNQVNPELREAAWAEMQSMLGTSPMTSTDLNFRHPNMTS